MNERPKTLFIDIDGTLLYHYGTQHDQITKEPILLSGVLEKFHEWEKLGYKIILVTGRKSGCRIITEQQLEKLGIIYDELIMGLTNGIRVIINDLKFDSNEPTVKAICIPKNVGINEIEL